MALLLRSNVRSERHLQHYSECQISVQPSDFKKMQIIKYKIINNKDAKLLNISTESSSTRSSLRKERVNNFPHSSSRRRPGGGGAPHLPPPPPSIDSCIPSLLPAVETMQRQRQRGESCCTPTTVRT